MVQSLGTVGMVNREFTGKRVWRLDQILKEIADDTSPSSSLFVFTSLLLLPFHSHPFVHSHFWFVHLGASLFLPSELTAFTAATVTRQELG